LNKDQIKNIGEDKRKMTVTENYGPSSVGKNFKRLGETITARSEELKIERGSKVTIVSGTHKGLKGKVVAVASQKSKSSAWEGQNKMDNDTYLSVELRPSGTVVEVKRKRIELTENVQKRSRSRSPQKEHKL
jgi:transcription antitermination factor NusG